jgi:hypothetical protein
MATIWSLARGFCQGGSAEATHITPGPSSCRAQTLTRSLSPPVGDFTAFLCNPRPPKASQGISAAHARTPAGARGGAIGPVARRGGAGRGGVWCGVGARAGDRCEARVSTGHGAPRKRLRGRRRREPRRTGGRARWYCELILLGARTRWRLGARLPLAGQPAPPAPLRARLVRRAGAWLYWGRLRERGFRKVAGRTPGIEEPGAPRCVAGARAPLNCFVCAAWGGRKHRRGAARRAPGCADGGARGQAARAASVCPAALCGRGIDSDVAAAARAAP